MRLFRWIRENPLLTYTLFLLAFIPLYPKLPLFDIRHTWVYIRLEDFVVAIGILLLFYQILKNKVSIRSPLTIPIISFWVVGGIATLVAVLFIFPQNPDLFPALAGLHYLRRIEYLSLFFIAFAAIKSKQDLRYVIATISIVLVLVVLYGTLQKIAGFPAFLTMNEEFAKGTPLRLSELARIPSTFAGHYDLAAYLVLILPIMISLAVGYKKLSQKAFFIFSAGLGFLMLLFAASRVSLGVFLFTLFFLLAGNILRKRKILILPIIIIAIVLVSSVQGISQRFAQTFSQVDLVVNARTGLALGVARSITDGAVKQILIEEKQSTGEDLPEGSKYIIIPAKPSDKFPAVITFKRTDGKANTQITTYTGDFVVKKAIAYDVSFTTRLQGGWPKAIQAFQKNIFLGSGYSSLNLATDNNYLRILGEIGLLGFISFLMIFIVFGIMVRRILPDIDSRVDRYFIIGLGFGVFGLALNAFFIDVFEASKIAFVLWMLLGVTVGLLKLYQKSEINYGNELKKFFVSTPVVAIGLLLSTFILYAPVLNNFFVGDDFTWLRWIADCEKMKDAWGVVHCESVPSTILRFFTDSTGFFYRPGTKLYFFSVYPFFELSPWGYHMVSVLLHFLASLFVFLITSILIKKRGWALFAAVLFLIGSGASEAVYWISVTGTQVVVVCVLLSLYTYMFWQKTQKFRYMLVSFFGLGSSFLFQELAIVGPLIIVWYQLTFQKMIDGDVIRKNKHLFLFLLLIPLYYLVRQAAHSLWMSGDYSYSLIDLPLNAAGNIFGYLLLFLFGAPSLTVYQMIRGFSASHVLIAGVTGIVICLSLFLFYKKTWRNVASETKHLVVFLSGFFVISLLPYLGLGNIAQRYLYLASSVLSIFFAFTISKMLVSQRKNTVVVVVTIVTLIAYGIFHFTQLRRTDMHWEKAGESSKSVMVSLNRISEKNPVQFSEYYFVNTPIRYGNAWVFPVGLTDAVWFTQQSVPLSVISVGSIEEVSQETIEKGNVFVFDDFLLKQYNTDTSDEE